MPVSSEARDSRGRGILFAFVVTALITVWVVFGIVDGLILEPPRMDPVDPTVDTRREEQLQRIQRTGVKTRNGREYRLIPIEAAMEAVAEQ